MSKATITITIDVPDAMPIEDQRDLVLATMRDLHRCARVHSSGPVQAAARMAIQVNMRVDPEGRTTEGASDDL